MTAQEAEKKLEELFSSWILGIFKNTPELLGVFQFGSTTKSPLKRETDLDLLLIFDHLPKNRMEQFKSTLSLENQINSDLKSLEGFQIQVSLILRTKAQLDHLSSFYLDFLDAGKIRLDTLGLLKILLVDIQNWISKNGAHKVQRGSLWYWVYSDDPQRTTPISFRFR